MQIMGETARMLGYRGILHELLEPRVNTAIGCQYLSLLLAQKVELPKALFAYNHGPGSTFKDGVAGKPEYHERVITHMDSPRINFLLQM
jgi:soluble lytic murein transglycosylase-like protein